MFCNKHWSSIDVQLVQPPGELLLNITSCLILAHWPHDIKTWRHPQNRKYLTYCNAIRGGPSHGHSQHAQNLVKFGCVVFEICEQTDRQTKAIIYRPSRFRLLCCILMNLAKHCNCLDVQLVPPPGERLLSLTSYLILDPWYVNMTSSTKPEMHNIATPSEEDWATAQWHSQHEQIIRWNSALWYSSYVSRQTDRQTNRHTQQNTWHPSQGWSNNLLLWFDVSCRVF